MVDIIWFHCEFPSFF